MSPDRSDWLTGSPNSTIPCFAAGPTRQPENASLRDCCVTQQFWGPKWARLSEAAAMWIGICFVWYNLIRRPGYFIIILVVSVWPEWERTESVNQIPVRDFLNVTNQFIGLIFHSTSNRTITFLSLCLKITEAGEHYCECCYGKSRRLVMVDSAAGWEL